MKAHFQQDPPLVRITREPNFQVDGYLVDILNEMKQQSGKNISYTYYEAPDGLFGSKNDIEEWSGMIGELQRGVIVQVTKYISKNNSSLGRRHCRCRVDNLFATFRSRRFHRSFHAFGHKHFVQNAHKRREQAVCLFAAIIVGSLGKRKTIERLMFKSIF